MKSLILKWLGVEESLTRAEVETMLADHFKQVQEFFDKSEVPQVQEKKQLTTRARNFSQFRDKVESSLNLDN